MEQVRRQVFKVEKDVILRVVKIYGKHRARVYDNGSLVIEIFADKETEALGQGGQWVQDNYKVLVHPNASIERKDE
jgi:hypothetical protein